MYLNEYLVAVAQRRIQRLIINIPVRHGKSELGSGNFPAFYLGVNPDDQVLLGGHSAGYAEEWGSFARNLLESEGMRLYGVTVDHRTHSKTNWRIANHRGRMISRGVGGSFPGLGAAVLIIDDPIRSPADAYSRVRRESMWQWYQGIVRSRLDPGGAIVLIMSRWHKDDLAGRLMEHWDDTGEPYTHLHLPALAEANDPLGRAESEALWPDRKPKAYDKIELESIRRDVGPRTWWAQYQGQPQSEAGEFFRREYFRYFDFRDGHFILSDRIVPLRSCRTFQTVDLATSEKTEADYFVVGTFALDRIRRDLFVMDVYRAHLPQPQQIPKLLELYGNLRPGKVLIEKYGMQLGTVQSAVQAGLPAFGIDRGRNDVMEMANYIATRYAQGTVYHPRWAAWKSDFEDELTDFPRGAHDDQVNVIAYAGQEILLGTDDYGPTGTYVPPR